MEASRTKLSPFVFINDISLDKKNLIAEDPELIKDFSSYLTTKHFSYFSETLFIANEINMCSTLEEKEKYDYFFYGIPARKRWTKWCKKENNQTIELIKEYYNYNNRLAEQVLRFFTDEDIEYMQEYCYKGGMK